MAPHQITRALLSVSYKAGLVPFAKELEGYGVELISTGGTAMELRVAGLVVTDVAEYTGFPEMMDGRVKTLHPKIHGGLLGRRDIDGEIMRKHGIPPIDLLVVNLYPFTQTVKKGAGFEQCLEQIDIGGPGMIRSGAKNHEHVTVVVDPNDYPRVLKSMYDNHGGTTLELRRELAEKVFRLTSEYDLAVANFLASQRTGGRNHGDGRIVDEL